MSKQPAVGVGCPVAICRILRILLNSCALPTSGGNKDRGPGNALLLPLAKGVVAWW
jgi:hypothetical protein